MATYIINTNTLDTITDWRDSDYRIAAYPSLSSGQYEASTGEIIVSCRDELTQLSLAQLRTILGANAKNRTVAMDRVWEKLEALFNGWDRSGWNDIRRTPYDHGIKVATATATAVAPAKRKAKREHRLAGTVLTSTGKTTDRMRPGTVLHVLTEAAALGITFEDLQVYYANNFVRRDGRHGTKAEAIPHINWAVANGFLTAQ